MTMLNTLFCLTRDNINSTLFCMACDNINSTMEDGAASHRQLFSQNLVKTCILKEDTLASIDNVYVSNHFQYKYVHIH